MPPLADGDPSLMPLSPGNMLRNKLEGDAAGGGTSENAAERPKSAIFSVFSSSAMPSNPLLAS